MKFSLISATSIFALLSTGVWQSHAAVLTAAPSQTNIFDLVDDGATSSDGGDSTVTRQDPLVSAVTSLESATVGWQGASFTGPVDPFASATAVPRIPLGAAPGTPPDDDFAMSVTGAWQWSAPQRASAIGLARIASLIGTVGNGPSANDKSDSTVFVAAGSAASFNDGGDRERSSSVAALATSSTSTATITVAGAGNFRQRSGSGFSVAAANSLQAMPVANEQAPPAMAEADTVRPALGYNYAPLPDPTTKTNSVEASFSDAVTASGTLAQLNVPVMPAKIQTSELQSGRAQLGQAANGRVNTSELLSGRAQLGQAANGKVQTSDLQSGRVRLGQAANGKVQTSELRSGGDQTGQFQTSDVAAKLSKLIDLTQPIEGSVGGIQGDGTRSFISASVSANPATTAALYMANVVNAAPTVPTGQTVEAFQVGPTPGPHAQGGPSTTVSDPLHGKIMASAGALNNSLALP